jgi:hypothetical protein
MDWQLLCAFKKDPMSVRVIVSVTATAPGSVIPVPVVSTNGQFLAYWYSPPYIQRTNSIGNQPIATMWVPEASTDGLSWTGLGSECVHLPARADRALKQPCLTCLHFVEVKNATDQVRIRLVSY